VSAIDSMTWRDVLLYLDYERTRADSDFVTQFMRHGYRWVDRCESHLLIHIKTHRMGVFL
jgi:hypothetical protein